MLFFYSRDSLTDVTDVISTYIALTTCKKEKSFFFSNIVYDGTITFLYHLYVIMRHLQFPNVSQITAQQVLSVQTLEGGKISLAMALMEQCHLKKKTYELLGAIWYHLFNLKNVKNIHGRLLLLVKLQALACNFIKTNSLSRVFFTCFKLYKWYQIAEGIIYATCG